MQMLIRILSLILFVNFLSPLRASHISGGDVTVQHIEGNTFEVTLQLFRDCINANPAAVLPADLVMYFYRADDDFLEYELGMNLVETIFPELGDECYEPEICIEIGVYRDTLELADLPGGYYLSWERCCRVDQTTNLFDAGVEGMVFTASIPDPALMNSSPQFAPYPNDGYFCLSTLNSFSFNAVDVDGDSLVYSLSTPIKGSFADQFLPDPIGGSPRPFIDLPWDTGYSLSNICGGSPEMSINSETGLITAAPDMQGFFAYGVVVEEYRDGVKIGEVRREITMESTICEFDIAPDFVGFGITDTVYILPFVANSIPILVEDNPTDSIEMSILYAESEIFNGTYDILAEYDTVLWVNGSHSGLITWDSLGCDYVRDEPYWAYFLTQSDNLCTGETSYDTLNLAIIVQLPPNLPTVFTSPAVDFDIIFGQEDTYAFDVIAVDGNPYDTLELSMLTPLDFGFSPAFFETDSALLNVTSPFEWIIACEDIRDEPYIIDFQVITSRCFTRDTTFLPVSLTVGLPDNEPTILESPDTGLKYYNVYEDSTYCFIVRASDLNNIDTLFISADFESELFTMDKPATFADTSGLFDITSEFCWTPRCENVRDEPYRVDFTVITKNCEVIQTIDVPMDIFVSTPSLGILDTIPNVFSPNGDNWNDEWRIVHEPDYCVREKRVEIFDRWGIPVFESPDLLRKWDGTYNDNPATDGAYYYTIQYNYLFQPRSYKGTITLLR